MVLDPGGVLDAETQEVVSRLSKQRVDDWERMTCAGSACNPTGPSDSLPEKRIYGSDFPFVNKGQLDGVHARVRVNSAVVSSAYGGFSNIWGAQIMPFSAATFKEWPFGSSDMEVHYRTILRPHSFRWRIRRSRETLSPHWVPRPASAAGAANAYGACRLRPASRSCPLHWNNGGRARLAFSAPECQPCGLCMTGCPRSLIFSASHSFDR